MAPAAAGTPCSWGVSLSSVSPAGMLSSSSELSPSHSPVHLLKFSLLMLRDARFATLRIPSLFASSTTRATLASFLSTGSQNWGRHAIPSDACVCLLDNFTHYFHFITWKRLQDSGHQIVPIGLRDEWTELLFAESVKFGSAKEGALHSSVTFHQFE